jgi:peroxisomal membrane protein 4
MGLGSLSVKKGLVKAPPNSFPILATTVWAIVMWLFRHNKDTLQGSLASSMEYLYNDSDIFDNFWNWLWHNR